MSFLFLKLFPWILCAAALGLAMGWVGCDTDETK